MNKTSTMHAGELVQVRSKEEILQTLDSKGQLDGLPFMPEMFEFCGKRLRVFKRAHKTCDPPNGLAGRRMLDAVHLEDLRCNGEAHGGCQARCLIFWKVAWLKRVEGDPQAREGILNSTSSKDCQSGVLGGCTEQEVIAGASQGEGHLPSGEQLFVCQSTQIPAATQPLRWWDLSQYIEDYTSGNVRFSSVLTSFLFFLYAHLASAGLGLGSALRWVYDVVQRRRGGTPYPLRFGKIRRGQRTPSAKLDLKPGELVRIRSYPEILETIDDQGFNRGMCFDAEMVPYCGREYRVLGRVTRIIDEKTGKLRLLNNDCIMLDGVICKACYSKYRRFCPRSIFAYWREIWLERVESHR